MLLRVDGLSKAFGGNQALDGVSLGIPEGSLLGLIGPNGSGKTTFINVVGGLHHADSGRLVFNGVSLDTTSPERRARLGIGRTFQLSRLFPEMTVLDNMLAVAPEGPDSSARQEALGLLERVRLSHMTAHYAGELSYGQGRLLEFARALMLHPRLMLLDEPAAGVHPRVIEQLQEQIIELNRQGTSFVIVEHNIQMVAALADRVVVLHNGRMIADGSMHEVSRMPAVQTAYLGTGGGLRRPQRDRDANHPRG